MQCPKCLGQGAQRAAQGVDLVSWHDTASLAGQWGEHAWAAAGEMLDVAYTAVPEQLIIITSSSHTIYIPYLRSCRKKAILQKVAMCYGEVCPNQIRCTNHQPTCFGQTITQHKSFWFDGDSVVRISRPSPRFSTTKIHQKQHAQSSWMVHHLPEMSTTPMLWQVDLQWWYAPDAQNTWWQDVCFLIRDGVKPYEVYSLPPKTQGWLDDQNILG